MRYTALVLTLLLGSVIPASAEVSVGIALPGVSIGINLPVFPQLVPVPGYPVYYAPGQSSNYFFYDGLYWVLTGDEWYSSSWYNGPWYRVVPERVPLFLLRVPVRYYRSPPPYFRGWQPEAPPHWGEHWGPQWEDHRRGWDHWDRHAVPAPAPLPRYQRHYRGDRYPGDERQPEIERRNYHFQPHDADVRRHLAEQDAQRRQPRQGQDRPREQERVR